MFPKTIDYALMCYSILVGVGDVLFVLQTTACTRVNTTIRGECACLYLFFFGCYTMVLSRAAFLAVASATACASKLVLKVEKSASSVTESMPMDLQ
jgi:hypothetical protein